MTPKDLKSELDHAIDVREGGDLDASRLLFESLVSKVKKLLKKDTSDEFKYFYLSLMGEYVVQHRLEGGRMYLKALELGKDNLLYDEKNKVGNPFSLRSISHTLQNMGSFEEAEPYFRKQVELTAGNPFKQGEELCHLALCVFRQARLEEAEKLINQALIQITENRTGQRYANVPYTRALTIKALIMNAKTGPKEALLLSKEALSIAKKDKLVFRIKQAEKLVEFFQKKVKAQ